MQTPPSLKALKKELTTLTNPGKASHHQRFFKTGLGEYGEGDRFRGITVPLLRKLARKYALLSFEDAKTVLESPWHEDRLLALFLLIQRFQKGDETHRQKIYAHYLGHLHRVNNWDLVDASAMHVVGAFLERRPEKQTVLKKLALSSDLWHRRVAMIATYHDIRKKNFKAALAVAEILVNDSEDLIHKAVGWMLREMGKRDLKPECDFLDRHATTMPRTMLRYAIEKFPEKQRKAYMALKLKDPISCLGALPPG